MYVTPQSLNAARNRKNQKNTVSSQNSERKTRLQPQVVAIPSKNRSRRLENLPYSQAYPKWLRTLIMMQRSSDIMMFSLVTAMLTIYGLTVYTQQLWTKEYRKLDHLQRQERQMTAANEVLKNQLAQQAENPATGLIPPDPAKTIFLPAAPQRHFQQQPSTAKAVVSPPKPPLGY
ncbi:MAG TPA: hypothetical protein V6D15_12240 [Oculatellaceae cyanobacterium]|jgi:hypothetical protein